MKKKTSKPELTGAKAKVNVEAEVSLGGADTDKELARWIYYEDGSVYYCYDCIQKRVDEINRNKEFADDIDYEGGYECGYWEDYADEDYEVECCKCGKSLYSYFNLASDESN